MKYAIWHDERGLYNYDGGDESSVDSREGGYGLSFMSGFYFSQISLEKRF